MASVLHTFQQQMTDLGLLCCFPQEKGLQLHASELTEGTVPFVGPCWMDDLCICLTAPSNPALESALRVASGAILDIFKGLAMTPNLKPGKTAVLISPRGAGTRNWKTRLFGPVSDGFFHCIGEHHPYQIPIVTGYTHLGGKVHFSGTLKKEIQIRIGQANQEFNRHRTLLYQNKHFSMDKKREIFHSLILSRLLYGAETWVLQDQRSKDYLHGSLIGLFKRLLKCRAGTHISDDEVLYRTGMSSPTDLLRARRLRYLGSLCEVGDSACWGLLNRDRDWIDLVRDDLRWMWRQLSHTCTLGDPDLHLARWIEIITWHRSYWKRLVRRALEHAIGVQRRSFQVSRAHVHMLALLEHSGLVHRSSSSRSTVLQSDSHTVYGCMLCEKPFKSFGGEGAHMCRCHGHVHPVRTLMGTTQCQACLKEYHTMGRLKAHLLRADHCRTTLVGRGMREEIQPGIGSHDDRLRCAMWDGRLPPLPAEGPLPCPNRQRDFSPEHIALYEDLVLCLMDVDVEGFEPHVRQLIHTYPISWTQCQLTIREVLSQLAQEGIPDCDGADLDAKIKILTHLQSPKAWAFLLVKNEPVAPSLPAIEELTSLVASFEVVEDVTPVPRLFFQERVFLHAFSGRRRAGDLQHYLESAFGRFSEGKLLHVVSMDVVIDPLWGDARNEEIRKFWLDGARRGFVQGGLCGPPCETWSQARFAQVEDSSRRQPRPLRSSEEPWGLPSLSLRELEQIEVGNELLLFSFDLLTSLAISGGCGALEHPGEPKAVDKPSIWRLAFVQLLAQLPGFQVVDFAQGLLGASTPKPTRLLTLNLDTLPSRIHAHRLCPDLPRRVAIGRLDSGQWATTGLKEYPPALNKALGEAFAHHLQGTGSPSAASVEAQFLDRCRSMHVSAHGTHMGPDFAG